MFSRSKNMGLKIIYPILVIFCTFPHIKVYGKVEESLVRLERIENSDRKIVTLVNSDQIVNFLLESDGNIVDCSVTRMRSHLVKIVRYEIEYTLSNNKTEKLIEPLDVPWYARRCAKTLRDLARNGNRSDPKVSEILERQALNQAVQGSKFCTRKAPTWNAEMTYDNLISVDKSQWLKDCLENDPSEESVEVHRLFFSVLDLKCYDQKTSEICNHYSTWFDKCEEAKEDHSFVIKDFKNTYLQ